MSFTSLPDHPTTPLIISIGISAVWPHKRPINSCVYNGLTSALSLQTFAAVGSLWQRQQDVLQPQASHKESLGPMQVAVRPPGIEKTKSIARVSSPLNLEMRIMFNRGSKTRATQYYACPSTAMPLLSPFSHPATNAASRHIFSDEPFILLLLPPLLYFLFSLTPCTT